MPNIFVWVMAIHPYIHPVNAMWIFGFYLCVRPFSSQPIFFMALRTGFLGSGLGENGTSVTSISTTLFLLDEIYEPVSWLNSICAIKLSMLASSSWRPLTSLKRFLVLDRQTIEKWPLMPHDLQFWFHAGHASRRVLVFEMQVVWFYSLIYGAPRLKGIFFSLR